MGVTLAGLLLLYGALGQGKLFEYVGWMKPRRTRYWFYALLFGFSGAAICLSVLKLEGFGVGSAAQQTLFYSFTVGPVVEEVFFRGIVFNVLNVFASGLRVHGRWRILGPLLLSGALFAGFHGGRTLLISSLIFLMGLAYGVLRWRSNSVAVAALMQLLTTSL